MKTSSNGNIFHVTGHLRGEFTGHRWIPRTNGQWCGALMHSLIFAWINDWVNNGEAGDLRRHFSDYDVAVMSELGGNSSGNGLSSVGRQASTWTNTDLFAYVINWALTNKLQRNLNKNAKHFIYENAFKISSAKCRPFFPGRDEFKEVAWWWSRFVDRRNKFGVLTRYHGNYLPMPEKSASGTKCIKYLTKAIGIHQRNIPSVYVTFIFTNTG